MAERFIPKLPPAKPPVARFIPKPIEPEPDPKTLPFEVGDYLDINMSSPVGDGQRYYLVIHVYPRKRAVRLFHVPTLEAFDIDFEKLLRNRTMKKRNDEYRTRVAKRIREHRREHKALGMRITADVDMALAALNGDGHG